MSNGVNSEGIVLPGSRLEKLEKIRKLFVFPMALWFLIVILDVLCFVFRNESFTFIRVFIGEIAFYSFPILLLYLVVMTFYSSYRILESKNYKNMAVFFLIQTLAYFIRDVVKIDIPVYSQETSIILTFVICCGIFLTIFVVQFFIKIPEKNTTNLSTNLTPPRLGMVFAAIFSCVIASMIYFRVKEGIPYIIWGVFFGFLLASIFLKTDKMIIGLFYFLDPSSAYHLYRLKKLKEKVEHQKGENELLIEEETLERERMKTDLIKQSKEIDKEIIQVQYSELKNQLNSMLTKIKSSGDLPISEKSRIITEIKGVSEQLKKGQNNILLALPEPDYKNLSLGERVALLTGFDDNEIDDLIKEGFIEKSQKYFWTKINQNKIRISLREFEEEQYVGKQPVLVAKSWEYFFEKNLQILKRVTDLFVKSDKIKMNKIKGTAKPELFEQIFVTVAKKYSAVYSIGFDNSYLIYGVFEIID